MKDIRTFEGEIITVDEESKEFEALLKCNEKEYEVLISFDQSELEGRPPFVGAQVRYTLEQDDEPDNNDNDRIEYSIDYDEVERKYKDSSEYKESKEMKEILKSLKKIK